MNNQENNVFNADVVSSITDKLEIINQQEKLIIHYVNILLHSCGFTIESQSDPTNIIINRRWRLAVITSGILMLD